MLIIRASQTPLKCVVQVPSGFQSGFQIVVYLSYATVLPENSCYESKTEVSCFVDPDSLAAPTDMFPAEQLIAIINRISLLDYQVKRVLQQ